MKFYIIGNGGLAKEVLFLCKEVYGTIENFAGFIDYKPENDNVFFINIQVFFYFVGEQVRFCDFSKINVCTV